MNAVFVKLGGSLITDKATPNQADHEVIKQVAEEIAELRAKNPDLVWFIGNGAGSYGHFAVHDTEWHAKTDDPLRIAKIRQAAGTLNSIILKALLVKHIPALAMPPAVFAKHDGTSFSVTPGTLFSFAKLGNVPLVYGDMVYDPAKGAYIMSTEEALDELARAWTDAGNTIQSYIFCTSVDGVLDHNKKTIPLLHQTTDQTSISSAKGFDATGGMKQKVEYAFKALNYTKNVYIINGKKPGHLSRAINLQNVDTKLA